MRSLWVFAAMASVALCLSGCNCNGSAVVGDGGPGGGDGTGGGTGGGATGGGTGGGSVSCTTDQPCYPFAAGTPGTGACRSGTAQCLGGTLGPCIGAVGPSAEACNGTDDDCNGQVDDGLGTVRCGLGACAATVNACAAGVVGTCTAGAPVAEICGNGLDDDCDGVIDNGCACIHVSPAGVDVAGGGSAAAPVRHLTFALGIAQDAGLTSLCVASGTTCPSAFDYGNPDGGEALTMVNGISVLGGFRDQSPNPWTQRDGGCVTRITAQTAEGTVFDHPVTTATALDQFDLVGGDFPTAAAVTVRGSTGAVLSNDTVTGGSGATTNTSIGVDVTNVSTLVATPLITRSSITGAAAGDGGVSIGVRSVGSAPRLVGNCPTFDAAGRCTAGTCMANGGPVGVRGAPSGTTATQTGTAYGVLLDGSPAAEIDSSAVCASPGFGQLAFQTGAAIKVQNDAQGLLIRRNTLFSYNASGNSVGLWMDACNAASPWIFDNARIVGTSNVVGSRSDGVRAVGDCHPRVDSNLLISGGVEAAGQDTNGVYCARDSASGIASRCTVLANTLIQGSGSGFPPRSVGVRCDDGACTRIEGNARIDGRGGVFSAGVVVSRSGPLVARNHIYGGCPRDTAIGLQSVDAFARVENNDIHGLSLTPGGACAGVAGTLQSHAVAVVNADTSNEIDLHSNALWGDGLQVGCVSRGLSFDATDAGAAPSAPRGLVRNNIISGGLCTIRFDVEELNAAADPRVLLNNWFDRGGAGTPVVFYRDEASTDLLDAGAVNALADVSAAGNIEGTCGATSANFHITATSVCRNAGTDAGAPPNDFDRDLRPNPADGLWDIGADEFY